MSNVIPFDEKLPAHLRGAKAASVNNALTQGVSGGFSVLSIKGKTFTLVQDGERRIITKPDDDDEPASSLEVVIVNANPNLSKTYYAADFEEGANLKPTCYSDDGKKPAADAESPQCKTCAACPRNAWGSGKQGRGKACSDVRRLAISPAGQINEPMLLRVPPASLRSLQEYGKTLANRSVAFDAVVTRVRFDPSEASPKLLFKAVGFLPEETYKEVQEFKNDELVMQIIGLEPSASAVPAPKAAAVEVEDEDEDEVEEAPKPAPKAKKAAPKPAPEPVVEEADEEDDDLDALLAEFDD